MPSPLDDIHLLFESITLEAKLAQGRDGTGQVPESLWETYSAFANTIGGTILLGVGEAKDGSLFVAGVGDAKALRDSFWSMVNDPDVVNLNILTPQDVQIVHHHGHDTVLIHVPRAPTWQQPVFCGEDPYSGTYKRDRASDLRCGRVVVDLILQRAASYTKFV